jgi:hypothetical protein
VSEGEPPSRHWDGIVLVNHAVDTWYTLVYKRSPALSPWPCHLQLLPLFFPAGKTSSCLLLHHRLDKTVRCISHACMHAIHVLQTWL